MREAELYPWVHSFLEARFRDRVRPTYGALEAVSAITATAGGAASGYWSRPDLALAALWRGKYALDWTLDLHAFEVKTETGCTPAAVHEALSHAAMVHYAHLVWHKPEWDDGKPECRAIVERCERYGIGLIHVADFENVDEFTVRLAARRHEPTVEAVDEFIETRFPDTERTRLLNWIEERR